jgi:hypothetical protein
MVALAGNKSSGDQHPTHNPRLSSDNTTYAPWVYPGPVSSTHSYAMPHSPATRVLAAAFPRALVGIKEPTYRDDLYYRIHVIPNRIDLGNLLTTQTRTVEVWNAYDTPQLLSSIGVSGGDGVVLSPPVGTTNPPTTFKANESKLYSLAVSVNGPPTVNADYVFNFPAESPALAVLGKRVVLWPFVPQIQFRETLAWNTDVIQTYSQEQRMALYSAPRQGFQYDYQLTQQQYSRAKAMAGAWSHRVFGVPVWAESTLLGALVAGATVLNFSTANADYRANDVIVLWQDDNTYDAVETTSLTSTSIGLKLPLARTYAKAYVAPLRFAYALTGVQLSRQAGYQVSKARVQFSVNNNVDLTVGYASPYPQYRSRDVLTDPYVVLGDLNERISRAIDQFDNGSGPITVESSRGLFDRAETLTFNPQTRAEMWATRRWLHARRGKQKTFWMPSWNDDLVMVNNLTAGGVTLRVQRIDYALFYGVTDVMFLLTNGTKIFRRVLSGVLAVDGNEELQLEASTGVDINVGAARICFIRHVRLDADTIEFQRTYNGAASATVSVLEVPEGN